MRGEVDDGQRAKLGVMDASREAIGYGIRAKKKSFKKQAKNSFKDAEKDVTKTATSTSRIPLSEISSDEIKNTSQKKVSGGKKGQTRKSAPNLRRKASSRSSSSADLHVVDENASDDPQTSGRKTRVLPPIDDGLDDATPAMISLSTSSNSSTVSFLDEKSMDTRFETRDMSEFRNSSSDIDVLDEIADWIRESTLGDILRLDPPLPRPKKDEESFTRRSSAKSRNNSSSSVTSLDTYDSRIRYSSYRSIASEDSLSRPNCGRRGRRKNHVTVHSIVRNAKKSLKKKRKEQIARQKQKEEEEELARRKQEEEEELARKKQEEEEELARQLEEQRAKEEEAAIERIGAYEIWEVRS